jgi:S-adenosylmethionine-diacylglycerol 3-amino-3-carboxypropyl transferase
VDGNPAQNAMMELKLAAIQALDHATFFDIFAARNPSVVTRVYRRHLRPRLTDRARRFWDENLWIVAHNLYNYGRTGLFCRILRKFLRLLGISAAQAEDLFQVRSLEEQRRWYERQVAPKVWGPWSQRFISCKWLIYLAGVHPEQFKLVDGRHGIYDYVKERVEYVLTKVPLYSNYFLSVAITGRFRDNHVPPYLLAENFATLRNALDRVTIVNGWLGPYLDTLPPRSIDKFNLLDIFDWMPTAVFESTLRSVLRAGKPGATLIYRSGSYRLDPPESIRRHLCHQAELSRDLLAIDRSATYGSFYVFSVKDGFRSEEQIPAREPVAPRAAVLAGAPAGC